MKPVEVDSGSRGGGFRLPPWVTRWVRPRRAGPTEPVPRHEGGRAPDPVEGSSSYSTGDRVARPRRGRRE